MQDLCDSRLLTAIFLSVLLACTPSTGRDDDDASGDDDDASEEGPDWDSSSIDPERLAIWTGSPTADGVADLAEFDLVVLQENTGPGSPENAEFAALASELTDQGVSVCAWLEAGVPRPPFEIDDAIDYYASLGLDCVLLAGLGLEVQGNSLARAITFAGNARSAGLSVMITAADPAGVVGTIPELGSTLDDGDRLLLQGFVYVDGDWQNRGDWRDSIHVAYDTAVDLGATIVGTASGSWNAARFDYVFYAAWLDGLEAVGWYDAGASTPRAPLPFPGPENGGSSFEGPVEDGIDVDELRRETDTGTIVVNPEDHLAFFE